mmetsp:Transcript_54208/g.169385  ORF Transcript_54208/g.169385 Transcript_54208/m.169385 type:complete len:403 (-) Transcript_54208:98-1306(-)
MSQAPASGSLETAAALAKLLHGPQGVTQPSASTVAACGAAAAASGWVLPKTPQPSGLLPAASDSGPAGPLGAAIMPQLAVPAVPDPVSPTTVPVPAPAPEQAPAPALVQVTEAVLPAAPMPAPPPVGTTVMPGQTVPMAPMAPMSPLVAMSPVAAMSPMAPMAMAGAVNPMMQMQMAQMAQMTQMQQMAQMQMTGSMMGQMMAPMMSPIMTPMMSMPMAVPVMQTTGQPPPPPGLPPVAVEDGSDVEPLLQLSEEALGERIAAQLMEVKDAEKATKNKMDPGTFVGTLARYDPELGFGFVICPECVPSWGKSDIYIGQKNFVESGLDVGDVVAFQVEDNNGKPRVAMNPKILDDVTKLKRRLAKLKEAAKTVNTNNKRTAAAVSMAFDPGAKRVSLGGGLCG